MPRLPDPAASARLETLRARHAALLEEGGAMPSGPAGAGNRLSTGWSALDAWLGGGWSLGGLAELRGRGRSSLALAAVRAARAADLAAAWIDGTGGFHPATARADLARLDLLRVPDPRAPAAGAPASAGRARRRGPAPARCTQALRAADLLLRARAHALVVLDLPPGPVPAATGFRLERLARRARCALLLLQDHRRSLTGAAAPLLLQVLLRPQGADPDLHPPALEVRLLRQRAGPRAAPLPGHAPGEAVPDEVTSDEVTSDATRAEAAPDGRDPTRRAPPDADPAPDAPWGALLLRPEDEAASHDPVARDPAA